MNMSDNIANKKLILTG